MIRQEILLDVPQGLEFEAAVPKRNVVFEDGMGTLYPARGHDTKLAVRNREGVFVGWTSVEQFGMRSVKQWMKGIEA